MPSIAVLDDRDEPRSTVIRSISAKLPGDWKCVACPLLKYVDEYPGWLIKNDVHVLVADQVLNEQAFKGATANYKGHQVIESIRKVLPNFPIFLITAFPGDNDLSKHLAEAEDVLKREKLTKEINTYIPRMIRSGNRYAEEHKEQLAKLTRLAALKASGKASKKDEEELQALQGILGLAVDALGPNSKEASLKVLEKKLAGLDSLEQEIKKVLKLKTQIEK